MDRLGLRFLLTFENAQSSYAILGHVTEWGPYVVISAARQELFSGTM
jgi:hypothetical protein